MAFTPRELSQWWLIPLAPIFLVGLFFVAVSSLTGMAVGTAFLDGFPAWYAGPDPAGIDQSFIRGVLSLDRWLVGLVGLSSPWWAVVPGFVASAIWEWLTGV